MSNDLFSLQTVFVLIPSYSYFLQILRINKKQYRKQFYARHKQWIYTRLCQLFIEY